jgi:hypothetical protein
VGTRGQKLNEDGDLAQFQAPESSIQAGLQTRGAYVTLRTRGLRRLKRSASGRLGVLMSSSVRGDRYSSLRLQKCNSDKGQAVILVELNRNIDTFLDSTEGESL